MKEREREATQNTKPVESQRGKREKREGGRKRRGLEAAHKPPMKDTGETVRGESEREKEREKGSHRKKRVRE